ncbi:MAG: alpha/beta hydrolase [Ignavibacteriaceae bacterium]
MSIPNIKKKISTFSAILIILVPLSAISQEKINVWPGKIPGAIEDTLYKEIDLSNETGIYRISKVKIPTLTIFTPPEGKANGTAVLICPGGGYLHLAYTKEGVDIAKWLNSLGITAFVLKYRLPSDSIMKDKTIGPLMDAQKAMRIIRGNAEKWNINPDKIGVTGFSAGGHLASTLCTHYNERVYDSDTISAKPDFSILGYPVISMEADITHMGSRENLLGKNPTKEELIKFSNDKQVNKNTPPAFLFLAEDDNTVPIQNSINYFKALSKFKIPAELHIYEKGGHGFGLAKKSGTASDWPNACERWLREIGILSK